MRNNKDAERVVSLCTSAANQKNTDAMTFLGKIYQFGWQHITQDSDLSRERFLSAANLGNAVALTFLGLSSRGEESIRYFKLSAERGYPKGDTV